MLIAPKATHPATLSYYAFRKAVGWIAIGLPFALAIPVALLLHVLKDSISSYYYTPGAETLFVGSLCAISLLMLSAQGYDFQDKIAGMVAAVCALGVAFFPTSPDGCATCHAFIHYTFAGVLFSILAYFCLVLFRMTAKDRTITPKKVQRNLVYTVSGIVIIASMAMILVFTIAERCDPAYKRLHATFIFESTSLFAFGVAWLVKGRAFLRDADSSS